MSDSKIAIIADVHANYQALQAVFAHADKQGVSDIWFLGDAVGYGPDPHRCLLLLKKEVTNPAAWILGNHDEVMRYNPNNKSLIEKNEMNNHHHLRTQTDPIVQYIGTSPDNLTAFKINYDILDAFSDIRNFLLSHPLTSQVDNRFFLVHGGVRYGTPSTTYIYDRIHVYNEFFIPIYKITRQVLKKLKSVGIPGDLIEKLTVLKRQEIVGEHEFLGVLKVTIGDQHAEEHVDTIQKHAFLTTRKRFKYPRLNIFFFGHTHHPACFKGLNRTIDNNGPPEPETNKIKQKFFGGLRGAILQKSPPHRRRQKKSNFTADNMTFSVHKLEPGKEIYLDDEQVWFLNPGSVGQPRDGDPRASYLVLDTTDRIVQPHRVEYNIRAVQSQMKRLDMPVNLISRLSKGL
jgi:predicted phosphodiesterase